MFIISEISPQFHGDLKIAEQMILQSKLSGANAVKVQLYEKDQFGIERSYLSMNFKELETLKIYADNLNIPLFATPFTSERLKWCIDLEFDYLKVAGRMHLEMPELTKEILNKNIPTFVSVPSDLDPNSIEIYDNAIYLYCIIKYPTRIDEVKIPDFENSIFEGISDHSLGNSAALFASSRGAKYLEKHFTLKNSNQFITEQAHLGAMTMNDLNEISNISHEFEIIRNNL